MKIESIFKVADEQKVFLLPAVNPQSLEQFRNIEENIEYRESKYSSLPATVQEL